MHTHTHRSTKHSLLSEALWCTIVIDQSFTVKLKWPIETILQLSFRWLRLGRQVLGIMSKLLDKLSSCLSLLGTFAALPASAAFPSTALMALTASVCHMSQTAMTQTRILREAVDTHELARYRISHGTITRLQEFGAIFHVLARSVISVLQLRKSISNVSCLSA